MCWYEHIISYRKMTRTVCLKKNVLDINIGWSQEDGIYTKTLIHFFKYFMLFKAWVTCTKIKFGQSTAKQAWFKTGEL